jgi:hypothetical protein
MLNVFMEDTSLEAGAVGLVAAGWVEKIARTAEAIIYPHKK